MAKKGKSFESDVVVKDALVKSGKKPKDVASDKEKLIKEKATKSKFTKAINAPKSKNVKKKEVDSITKGSVKKEETEILSRAAVNATENNVLAKADPLGVNKTRVETLFEMKNNGEVNNRRVKVQYIKETGKILAMAKGDNLVGNPVVKLTKDLFNLRLIAIHKGYRVDTSVENKPRLVPIVK